MTRVFWATIGLIPLALCGALFFTDWRLLGGQYPYVGYGVFVLGAIVCIINFYISFLRYPIHRVLGKSKESYKHFSGIPLFGVLVLIGAWLLPQSLWLSLATTSLVLLDTGSILWFVVMAWSDSSF
jgi:hypothetical protein